jgi:hypothetical protein
VSNTNLNEVKKFIAELHHRDVFFDSVREDPAFKEIVAIAKQKHLAFQKEL